MEIQTQTCPACGQENRGHALFCSVCGSAIVVPEQVAALEEVDAPTAMQSVAPEAFEPAYEGEPVVPEEGRAEVPAAGRRRLIAAVVTGAVMVAIGIAFASADGPPAERQGELNLATARRGDIQSVRSFDGEIGSLGQGPPVLSRLSGTITDIAAPKTKVRRGQPLFAVDGQPVVLLYGALPAWRDIGADTTPGEDVKQLEENLDALDFDPGSVDERFTAETRKAVDDWLASLGLPRAGVVRLGRVVFARADLTVDEPLKRVGQPVADGEDVLSTISAEKVVIVELEEEGQLPPGLRLAIALPGRKYPAEVQSVGRSDADADVVGDRPTTQAIVVPDAVGVLAGLSDGADADVEVPLESRKGVVLIPVTALIARQSGGYSVEVPAGDGTRLVEVTPGLYSGDFVEIRKGLDAGDRVVVP